MSKEIRAAGYIRVSSVGQIDNESLTTQRKAIEEYCEKNNYKLTNIYADEGISGGSVKERKQLLQALRDARDNKFDALIIRDLSRFGRNARELLENHEQLEKYDIKLRSIKEGMNFGTAIGKAMLTMLAAIAELEMNMIKERMIDNRIAKARRGIPTVGNLPYGRSFDEQKEEWELDQNKVNAIEWVYNEYVKKDRSLRKIAEEIEGRFGFPITYHYLTTVLKEKCGDHWHVEFVQENAENIIIDYTIPRILEDHKIQEIKDRLAHNRTNNRTDTRDYLLTGFIRCEHCQKSLSGQSPHDGRYQYYVHPSSKTITCNAFTTIPLPKIEHAVFQTIFENIYDVPAFEEAIKNSLPDTDFIQELKKKIQNDQKQLKTIKKKRKRLVDAVLNGTLEQDSIQESDKELRERQDRIESEIEDKQDRLDNLPDPEEIKKEAHEIRMMLRRKYQSEEYLQNMSFDDKKKLLHFLFDGTAPNGDHYGIYVDKRGKGKNSEIDYFMFGRLTGLRTIKGDDIDYFPDEDDDNGNGNKGGRGWKILKPQKSEDSKDKYIEIDGIKRRKKKINPPEDSSGDSTHKNSNYKTNNFGLIQKNQKIKAVNASRRVQHNHGTNSMVPLLLKM